MTKHNGNKHDEDDLYEEEPENGALAEENEQHDDEEVVPEENAEGSGAKNVKGSGVENDPEIDEEQEVDGTPVSGDEETETGADETETEAAAAGRPPPPPARQELVAISWPIFIILLILAVIILAFVINALSQDRSAVEAVEVEVTRIVEVAQEEQQVVTTPAAVQLAYPPEQFFVQDELIVSGPAELVSEATGSLVASGTIAQSSHLDFASLLGGAQCPGLSGRPNQGQDLVIDLYTILDENTDVATLIEAIQNDQVIAEPNRISGFPWEIEGSPWEIEGSPWEIEGSTGGAGITSADAASSPDQWAFQIDAIDLPSLQETSWPTGTGILVGVFDTLPFDTPADGEPREVPVSWVQTPVDLELTVLNYWEEDTALPADETSTTSGMINHGLYVAGLVHAVAPGSDIELVRVLDETNRGNLFALNEALYKFMERMAKNNRQGKDAVINMSLGIRIPPLGAPGFAGLTREVHSLQDLLALARCAGIVVVAAAGNNSARVSVPELPNLPAAWSSVIGVAASNSANGRSCFSNLGDIGAPGGDGRETDGPMEICRPRNNECKGPACPFAVIGPISQTTTTSSGYAYWTGSSFAAPMVSGLAARVMEAGGLELAPSDVRAIIECGATKSSDRYLGAGVINVRRTIDECLSAYSPPAAE